MESIGQKLRQTREEKGYTLEQIARDTHIAKRFIEALEAEEFSAFPGDPYLIGFLRTYGTYLGLDGQEMVNLYKNIKLQEQPAPIDELIVHSGPRPIIRIALIVLIVGAFGIGGYFLFTSGIFGGGDEPDQQASSPGVTPQLPSDAFRLSEELVERRFVEGQTIVVAAGASDHLLEINDVGDSLALLINDRELSAVIDQPLQIDLDGDGGPDLQLTVRSLDAGARPPSAVIRINRDVRVAQAATSTEEATTEAVGSTSVPSRERSAQVVARFDEPEPYFVEIEFRGYALFRYELDSEPRQQQYFQNGDSFRVTVNDQLKFWISNAGVARLRVAGRDLQVGDPGEVTVGIFAWSEVDDGVQLELVPVY